jgi:hypothetical protein
VLSKTKIEIYADKPGTKKGKIVPGPRNKRGPGTETAYLVPGRKQEAPEQGKGL